MMFVPAVALIHNAQGTRRGLNKRITNDMGAVMHYKDPLIHSYWV